MALTLDKILCPIDFSDPSRHAMDYAAEMALKFDAEVTLLHVYQDPAFVLPDGGVLMPQPAVMMQMLEAATQRLDAWRTDLAARGLTRVVTSIVQGVPWSEIHRSATDGKFGMIVIGTHGRTGIKHILLGSVAERVARHGPCPVLVVH